METQLYSNGNAISPKTEAETVYIDNKTIVEFINSKIKALRDDIEKPLKDKIDALENKLTKAQSQLTSLESENDNLRLALSSVLKDKASIENKLASLEEKLASLEKTSDFKYAFYELLKSLDTTKYLSSLLFDTSPINKLAKEFVSSIALQVSPDARVLEDGIRINLGFAPKYRDPIGLESVAPKDVSSFLKTSELSTSLHLAVNEEIARFRIDVGLDDVKGVVKYETLPTKKDFANFVLSDNSFETFKQECQITDEDLTSKINSSGILQPYAKTLDVISQLSKYDASWVQNKMMENNYLKIFVEATAPTRSELVTTVNSLVSASLDSHLSLYALKREVPTPGQVAALINSGYDSGLPGCSENATDTSSLDNWSSISGGICTVSGTGGDNVTPFIPGRRGGTS